MEKEEEKEEREEREEEGEREKGDNDALTHFLAAQQVIKKHTSFSGNDVKQIVEHIREGKGVKLPDDFVLREDLEELNFLVQ